MPYGTVGEHGLYFVAFSGDPSRYQRILARMFGFDGPRDRLSRAHILAAKTGLVAVATLFVALLSNVAGFLTGQRILSSEQISVSIRERDSINAIVAGAVAVSAFAVIGVGLGAIVRRAAVANILMALVVIGGQLFGSAMPMTAQKYLPFSALQASVSVERSDDLLSTLPAALVLVGYATATVVAAMYLINRRDV